MLKIAARIARVNGAVEYFYVMVALEVGNKLFIADIRE